MEFQIDPYKGVGAIRFGMACEQVRATIGGNVRQFKKTPVSEMLTDAFDGLGVHVYYKKPGICEAIEFSNPAEPVFMGKKLLGLPFNKVKEIFTAVDEDIEIDETGLTSYKYGIGIYVPTLKKSQKELVQGVIAFERGYYD